MADEKPMCQECEDELFQIGSHWVCQAEACGRFALPCLFVDGDFAYTREEWENECERRGVEADARAVQ